MSDSYGRIERPRPSFMEDKPGLQLAFLVVVFLSIVSLVVLAIYGILRLIKLVIGDDDDKECPKVTPCPKECPKGTPCPPCPTVK